MLLKDCSFVVDSEKVLKNVDILIENGIIKEIGKIKEDDEKINCKGLLIIPGFINMHTHAAMTFFRGFKENLPLQEWLKELWKIEEVFMKEKKIILEAHELALIEMLSSGTVGFVDMYFTFNYLKGLRKLHENYGIFIYTGPAFIDVFYPFEEAKKKLEWFIKETKEDEKIKSIVNVHSLYTNSLEDTIKAKELARENDLFLNIHVSETRKEVIDIKEKYGKYPVELLYDNNVLDEKTILVHLGWITNREGRLINEKGSIPVSCTTSNLKLSTYGFFPYDVLRKDKITLGTDGCASNNSLNMFSEMKFFSLLQKHNYWNPSYGKARKVFSFATKNPYFALGLNGGLLEKGKKAFLIAIKLKANLLPFSKENAYENIVFSGENNEVSFVVIEDKILYPKNYEDRAIEIGKDLVEWYRSLK